MFKVSVDYTLKRSGRSNSKFLSIKRNKLSLADEPQYYQDEDKSKIKSLILKDLEKIIEDKHGMNNVDINVDFIACEAPRKSRKSK